MRRLITAVWAVLLLSACAPSNPEASPPIAMTVQVHAQHPHDPASFTQGLELIRSGPHAGRLLESSGLYGASQLRVVDIESGRVEAVHDLPAAHFGEGLTVIDETVVQLTWREGVAHRYGLGSSPADPTLLDEVSYEGEGWGLCHDAHRDVVWLSDGSPSLRAHDPVTFEEVGRVRVAQDGTAVRNINELECVDGVVWANIWMEDRIVAIAPPAAVGAMDATAQIVATVDAAELSAELLSTGFRAGRDDVLNGIAHDPATGRWYVTGKRWPTLFEVAFVPQG